MDRIKVGVIGVGNMGKNHVRSYEALKHKCELVGIYDVDRATSEELAQGYGIKAFESVENLLENVDAVNIVTPTSTHYELAMKAIEKGVHLLIEKPITGIVEEARNILKSAGNKNLVLQVGHIERFNPVIRALPKLLTDKEIIALDVKRMGPYDPRINDTDVIQDLMIHDIDIVSSLVSDSLNKISAYGRMIKSENHMDYVVANLIMEKGVVASLTASRVTNKKVREMTITTDSSFIEVDYLHKKISLTQKGGLVSDNKDLNQEKLEEEYLNEEEPLKAQLAHFIDCIIDGTRPLIAGTEGLEALKITKKIQNQVYN